MTEAQQGRAARLGVAVAAMLAYIPALRSDFVSEDFLILRILSGLGPIEALWAHLRGPWLDLHIVEFYRPLSTFSLHMESLVFGTWHAGYVSVHIAVHGLATWLVAGLLQTLSDFRDPVAFSSDTVPTDGAREREQGPNYLLPCLAALLFGLFPLHPNAVTFVASFATLFSAVFVLLGLRLFLSHVVSRGRTVAGLACMLAACLCYEQAAVTPVLLVAAFLLRLGGPESRRARLQLGLAAIAVTAAFLLLRQIALGGDLGGYRETQSLLMTVNPAALLETFSSLTRVFLWPHFPNPIPEWTGYIGVAVVGLAAAVGVAGLGSFVRPSRELRIVALGAVWFAASMMPFGFVNVVPASGRYLYLSSVGGVAVFLGLCRWFVHQSGSVQRRLPIATAALLILNLGWLALLQKQIETQNLAGLQARSLRDAVLREDAEMPIALLGTPDFIRHGAPLAQVFHWGLSDALMEPFADGRPIYAVHFLAPRATMAAERDGWLQLRRWQNDQIQGVDAINVPICLKTRLSTGDAPSLVLLEPPPFDGSLRLITLTPQTEITTAVEPGTETVMLRQDAFLTYLKLFPDLPSLSWLELRSKAPTGQRPRVCTSKVYPSHEVD